MKVHSRVSSQWTNKAYDIILTLFLQLPALTLDDEAPDAASSV